MKKYLSSIGFSKLNTRYEIHTLIGDVIQNASRISHWEKNENEILFVYEKDYGEAFGMMAARIEDKNGYQEIVYWKPYVRGMNFLYSDKMEFEYLSDREKYQCICDENNIGIPLIFDIINPIEYEKLKRDSLDRINCAVISGIALSGMIILPVEEDEYDRQLQRQRNEKRNRMIDKAREGNVEAMEKLTLDDMDTYSRVTNRSRKEDVFTIVTSYFMPYTVECDKYSVLGSIRDVTSMKNNMTEEELYYLSINCNNIDMDIIIGKKQLMGEPEPGRRFKGNVWLMGDVDCV